MTLQTTQTVYSRLEECADVHVCKRLPSFECIHRSCMEVVTHTQTDANQGMRCCHMDMANAERDARGALMPDLTYVPMNC